MEYVHSNVSDGVLALIAAVLFVAFAFALPRR